MFVDYVTIQLIAAALGLLFAGIYIFKFENGKSNSSWVYGFWMTGFILLVTGLDMIFTWPLPGSYNIIFGEPSVWFGALLIFIGLAIRNGSDLMPLALLSSAGGLMNIVISIDILVYSMTQSPIIAFGGFITSGLGALMTPLGLKSKSIRWIIFVLLILSALAFAVTGYGAYYQHASDFAHYLPPTMKITK